MKYIRGDKAERNSNTPGSDNINNHNDSGIATASYNAAAENHVFNLDRGIKRKDNKKSFAKLFYKVIHTIESGICACQQYQQCRYNKGAY